MMSHPTKSMHIELIQVPYDVDRDDTAMAHAPAKLLQMGFLEPLRDDGHQITLSPVWTRAESSREAIVTSVARETARAVSRTRSRSRFPLVLSGGCLTAVGVVAGLQRTSGSLAILWIDAHGDFNTPESSPSGYWDGMSLAAVCGRSLAGVHRRMELRSIPYRRIVHLGGRALDPAEKQDFKRLSLLQLPADAAGKLKTVRQLRDALGNVRNLYLHVDMDGLDPGDAPGVNIPEPDGVRLEALVKLLEHLPSPTAMTLAGMNFERVGRKQAKATEEACVLLVRTVLASAQSG
jgi:arginase